MKVAEQIAKLQADLAQKIKDLELSHKLEALLEKSKVDFEKVTYFDTFTKIVVSSTEELISIIDAVPPMDEYYDEKGDSPYSLAIETGMTEYIHGKPKNVTIRFKFMPIEGKKNPYAVWLEIPYSLLKPIFEEKDLVATGFRSLESSEYHYYEGYSRKELQNTKVPIIKFRQYNLAYVGGNMRLTSHAHIEDLFDTLRGE